MELIDTHCHLDQAAFDADRPQVLQQCRDRGIRRIVVPAIAAAGWDRLLDLCRGETGLYPALGLHPVFVNQHCNADLAALPARLDAERPIAVGEIGLDFHLPELDRDRQLTLFEAQLEMARDAGLPVLLHVRKAHDQVLAALKRIRVPGGIAHAFNGSLQQARQYLELGFRLGFGGTLTYEGSRRIQALARDLPEAALVLETDAPDMVVAGHRGERNSPAYLVDIVAALARVRQQPVEELADRTTRNACEVLNLEQSAHD
ncbi:MAG TPA: TatD family deoxyribonuclease [Chromatiales bacterium]|nr:TatD family deoxyribonuclease [Chromatiales bacterium]